MFHEVEYKGYYIVLNFYGKGEYTVQYGDGDMWFDTVDEAKAFIDDVCKYEEVDKGVRT